MSNDEILVRQGAFDNIHSALSKAPWRTRISSLDISTHNELINFFWKVLFIWAAAGKSASTSNALIKISMKYIIFPIFFFNKGRQPLVTIQEFCYLTSSQKQLQNVFRGFQLT